MRTENDCPARLPVRNSAITACAAAALIFFVHCGTGTMESVWENGRVSLDGNYAEWSDCLYTVGGTKTSVGCMNDSTSLYLCLVSYDQHVVMQLVHGGCCVRFGRKKDNLPEVMVLAGGRQHGTTGADGRGFDDGSDMVGGQNEECIVRLIRSPPDSGSGPHPPAGHDAPDYDVHGIRAVLGKHNGCAVLEMVIPFELRDGDAVKSIVNESQVYLTVEARSPGNVGPAGNGGRRGGRGGAPPPRSGGMQSGGGMHHGSGPPSGTPGSEDERYRPQEESRQFTMNAVIRIAEK